MRTYFVANAKGGNAMKTKFAVITVSILAVFFLLTLDPAIGLEQVRLKEIITYKDGIEAVVVMPDGEELTVEEGDTLPDDYGEVAEIKERSVSIKKPSSDGKGNIIYQLALPAKPGSLRVD